MNRLELCETQCFEPNSSIASTSNPTTSTSVTDTELEVLFVDSFDSIENEAHSLQDGKRCGLIQFSGPIIIHELLLIPLFETARIRNGSVTLGATIPPEFDITFYVNDLKAEEASTFVDIGTLSYRQTDRYLFKPTYLVPTDGLFFRGNFENVTLSVHGVRVSVLPDEDSNSHVPVNVICDNHHRVAIERQRVPLNDQLNEDDLYYVPRDDEPNSDEARHHHQQQQQQHHHQQQQQQQQQQHSSNYKYSRTPPPPVTSIKSPSPAHSIKSSSSSNHRSNSQNLPKSFSRYIRDDNIRAGSSEHSQSHRSDRYHSQSSRRSPSPGGYAYRHHGSNHHRSASQRDSSVDSFEQGRRGKRTYYRGRPSSRGSNRSRSSSKSSQHSQNRSFSLRPMNSPKPHLNNNAHVNDNFSLRAFSPLSNASSISKTSLRSIGSVHENGSTRETPNRRSCTPLLRPATPQKSPTPVKAFQKELFETLSSSDDFSDLEEEVTPKKVKVEVQNFEKISWSSDDELGNEIQVQEQLQQQQQIQEHQEILNVESVKKNKLEEISSDEEIPNDDLIDFEMSEMFHDNDIDDSLDVRKNVFDPFKNNQLSEILFPLNIFGSAFNLDGKQLSIISESVASKFRDFYGEVRIEPTFDENWIKDVEQLAVDIMKLTLPLGEKTRGDCVAALEFPELIRILVCIAKDSLDFDLAQKQKQGFKIRHLKAGIKLFISLFYSLEMKPIVVEQLLESNLAYHLIILYDKPFMTLSMRLLLLNALNVACDHPEFVEYCITKQFIWVESNSDQSEQTLYQHMLELVLSSKGTSRLSNSFEEFFTKVHLFEFCQSFSNDFQNSEPIDSEDKVENFRNVFVKFSNQIHRPLRLFSDIPQFDLKSSTHASAPLLLLSMIELDSKNDSFNVCKNRLCCQHSSCPASKIGYFSQKAIYHYMKRWNILDVIADILDRLPEGDEAKNIVQLLDLISAHHQGRCYLLKDSHNVQLTNKIHSLLMSRNPALGIKFITRLFTFQTVDAIFQEIYSYPSMNSSSAFTGLECQVMNHLFQLDCMIHLDNGALRESVLQVLTADHNFDGVLAFLLPFTPGNPILDIQMSAFIYASRIASFCLQNLPERNIFHFLDSYGRALMKCFENMHALKKNEACFHWLKFGKFQVHFNSFLILEKWFAPFKNLNTSESKEELCINLILATLKKYGTTFQEKFVSQEDPVYRVFEFEPELLIALKMMLALCDPTVDYGKNRDPELQLCYKSNIVRFYSADCLSQMLSILEGVCETFSRPSHLPFIWNTFGESHSKGTIVLELVRVCIRLASIILNYVVASVGEKFQDPSPIHGLLNVFHFMSFYKAAYAPSSLIYQTAQSVQDDIIKTLKRVYCQVFITQTDSVPALKKSVWSKFIVSVFDFMLKKPRNILSALQVLVRILPDNDRTAKRNKFEFSYCKIWAVHFHILAQELENISQILFLSDCHQVQAEFRQLLYKLSSLYSPSVILVCKILCENILINLNILMKSRKESQPLARSFTNISKIISIVCDLFQESIPFRIGILHSLYHLGSAEVERKTTVKIYSILMRMFEYFDKVKYETDLKLDSSPLLKHIFSTTEDSDSSVETLFEQYYEENKKLIFEKENFTLSEKSLEKCRKSSNEALHDFFIKISVNSSADELKSDSRSDDSIDSSICSSLEFVSLHRSFPDASFHNIGNSLNSISDTQRLLVNFTEMSKEYLKIDTPCLNKTFETLFSTVIQLNDPNQKSEPEEKVPESNAILKRAPIRPPRRNNFSRVDLFRSRAPNTSRPPSMHVDDFEASQHNNSSGGMKRVSHHAALLQNNSAPYAKQHPDAFLRKKPLYTLTSVSGSGYK